MGSERVINFTKHLLWYWWEHYKVYWSKVIISKQMEHVTKHSILFRMINIIIKYKLKTIEIIKEI